MSYRDHVREVAKDDVALILRKDEEYGGSWLKRGGVGAAMMALRKVDRLEQQLKKHGYDVFAACKVARRTTEGLRDTLQDLRGYLILIEAELRAQEGPRMSVAEFAAGMHPAAYRRPKRRKKRTRRHDDRAP